MVMIASTAASRTARVRASLSEQGMIGVLQVRDIADDAGEQRVRPTSCTSLTARSMGKVELSFRRPTTSRPMPMIFLPGG